VVLQEAGRASRLQEEERATEFYRGGAVGIADAGRGHGQECTLGLPLIIAYRTAHMRRFSACRGPACLLGADRPLNDPLADTSPNAQRAKNGDQLTDDGSTASALANLHFAAGVSISSSKKT
jgi:hypothetical protein